MKNKPNSQTQTEGAVRCSDGLGTTACVVAMKNNLDEVAFGCFAKIHEWNLARVNNLLALAINHAGAALNRAMNFSCAHELLNQRIEVKHI